MRLIDADALTPDTDYDDGECWAYSKTQIDYAPTIKPEQRWIPVTERLPKDRRYVLVTFENTYGLIDHGIAWYGETEKKWNTSREVIAWMPLPEPYVVEHE